MIPGTGNDTEKFTATEMGRFRDLMREVNASGGRIVSARRVTARLELNEWRDNEPKKVAAMLNAYVKSLEKAVEEMKSCTTR